MRWDEEYGAVFYVQPPDDPEPPDWVAQQTDLVGVTRWREDDVAYGAWDEFAVDVHDVPGLYFRGIVLTFSANQFDVLRATKGRAFEDAFVADFRDACVRVEASAGFVHTLIEPPVEALAADVERDVTGQDLRTLLGRGLSLLYLSEGWFTDLSEYRPDPRRDEVPVQNGRLVFASSGEHRW